MEKFVLADVPLPFLSLSETYPILDRIPGDVALHTEIPESCQGSCLSCEASWTYPF